MVIPLSARPNLLFKPLKFDTFKNPEIIRTFDRTDIATYSQNSREAKIMALKTCPICQGTKKIKGLGMMKTDCPICEGTGKVESTMAAPIRLAATPLGRDSLSEDYFDKQRSARTAGMADANYAFKNTPKPIVSKENQNTPAGNVAQNTPVVDLTPVDLMQVKAQIKQRDDNIGMPKVTLSAAVQAEIKALEEAKAARDAAEAAKSPTDESAIAPISEEEMFGGVKCETVDAEVAAPHIVAPIVNQGVDSGKKRRQAKTAQA